MKKLLLAFATSLTLFGSIHVASADTIYYVTFGEWKNKSTVIVNETPRCLWLRGVFVNGKFTGNQRVVTHGEKDTTSCPVPNIPNL